MKTLIAIATMIFLFSCAKNNNLAQLQKKQTLNYYRVVTINSDGSEAISPIVLLK